MAAARREGRGGGRLGHRVTPKRTPSSVWPRLGLPGVLQAESTGFARNSPGVPGDRSRDSVEQQMNKNLKEVPRRTSFIFRLYTDSLLIKNNEDKTRKCQKHHL